ncbi:MAG: tyrosine-protein phosphatase, partial [Clostridia bacterium]|nr:tyrosine-protein phosphatase [Clostridia bacterium]
WDVSNILTGNIEIVKNTFEILADESNYPLIYHCNIGTDRTGLFAYLINGLMGVSEEDLYRDYLFSNFGKINGSRSLSGIKNSYIATIKSYQGDNLSEKIYNCLVDLGIPSEHLDSVIEILTED